MPYILLCQHQQVATFHVGGQLLQQQQSCDLQRRLPASGVSHRNIMPAVCQSALSEAHTEQSTRTGETLSMVMASRLVASCSFFGAGARDVHIPVPD